METPEKFPEEHLHNKSLPVTYISEELSGGPSAFILMCQPGYTTLSSKCSFTIWCVIVFIIKAQHHVEKKKNLLDRTITIRDILTET